MRLVNAVYGQGLRPVATLEVPVPELHPAQDIHEGDREVLPVTDGIVGLLAIPPADFGRNATGFQVPQEGGIGQLFHLYVAQERLILLL